MTVRSVSCASLSCLLLVVMALPACRVARDTRIAGSSLPAPLPTTGTIRIGSAGRVIQLPLDEYVLGTVLSEVSPVGETPEVIARVFEVQAVIARTYAVSHLDRHRDEGFDLCDQTHCQLYQPGRIVTSVFAAAARQAVEKTRGRVLAYAGRPVLSTYHADCGGHTASAADVWGGNVPYLTGEVDDVPSDTHRTWTFGASLTQLRDAFNSSSETYVGRELRSIRVVGRDESGRASVVELDGETRREVRGERVRTVLNQRLGERAILSSRFDITATASGAQFVGTGFGHGVGLCQVGAAARARRGDSLETILTAYFRGAELSPIRSVAQPPTIVRSAPVLPLPTPSPFPTPGPKTTATIAR